MKNKINYPTSYELEHVLAEFCNNAFINTFSQSKGIILIRSTKEEIASDLTNFFYDKSDLDIIKEQAYRQNTNHALSGFILNIDDSVFNPMIAIQKIREFYGADENINFEPITHERGETNPRYTGRVNYRNFKPGRLQFLQGEDRAFDYSLQKISTDQYQIFIDSSKSNDSKIFEDILKKQVGADGDFDIMLFEKLTTLQAIQFFDELANRFAKKEWQFQEVRHLVIKKIKNEDEEKKVTPTELSGITQAIIEGHNLREEKFVKQSEKEGYTFTAMTYVFSHTTSSLVIILRAEFKSRPKVFEISLVKYMRREGIEGIEVDIPIDRKEEYRITRIFWTIAKQIYNELTYGSRTLIATE